MEQAAYDAKIARYESAIMAIIAVSANPPDDWAELAWHMRILALEAVGQRDTCPNR